MVLTHMSPSSVGVIICLPFPLMTYRKVKEDLTLKRFIPEASLTETSSITQTNQRRKRINRDFGCPANNREDRLGTLCVSGPVTKVTDLEPVWCIAPPHSEFFPLFDTPACLCASPLPRHPCPRVPVPSAHPSLGVRLLPSTSLPGA